MLEYLDKDSRDSMIELIYKEFKAELSKSCTYGIPNLMIIQQWEDFRFNWLNEHIIEKLKTDSKQEEGEINGTNFHGSRKEN